jgi:hypothetical protein
MLLGKEKQCVPSLSNQRENGFFGKEHTGLCYIERRGGGFFPKKPFSCWFQRKISTPSLCCSERESSVFIPEETVLLPVSEGMNTLLHT